MNNNEILNDNRATSAERIENYLAGQELMRNAKKKNSKLGNLLPFSNLWAKGRKQHVQQNPIMPNTADILQWTFYDRYSYAAAGSVPTLVEFFTVPQNQGGKTKADTNMQLVAQLPSPEWMNVTHLGFHPDPTVLPADWNALVNQSYFEFWVNNKVYVEGKLNQFPSGSGNFQSSTQTNQSSVGNGYPMVANMFDVRLPAGLQMGPLPADGYTGITILQQQTFKVKMILPGGALTLTASTTTPPGTGLVISCYLMGQKSTTVQ